MGLGLYENEREEEPVLRNIAADYFCRAKCWTGLIEIQIENIAVRLYDNFSLDNDNMSHLKTIWMSYLQ